MNGAKLEVDQELAPPPWWSSAFSEDYRLEPPPWWAPATRSPSGSLQSVAGPLATPVVYVGPAQTATRPSSKAWAERLLASPEAPGAAETPEWWLPAVDSLAEPTWWKSASEAIEKKESEEKLLQPPDWWLPASQALEELDRMQAVQAAEWWESAVHSYVPPPAWWKLAAPTAPEWWEPATAAFEADAPTAEATQAPTEAPQPPTLGVAKGASWWKRTQRWLRLYSLAQISSGITGISVAAMLGALAGSKVMCFVFRIHSRRESTAEEPHLNL
eukprot:gnl/TRDRNA2_/TRDRNA2_87759_c0_seq1.p1 gnl/TRDRNA2_/TRDRNA2_87759_c0~~gnl/TRDRNA2_/TRDRNA2_87759_c0_seq1.p1  ORF type:complete len:273 (-),score=51.42 gnl/TRDRNA2_/TRDRNA2_87759_c0_seq1:375-1193(-)